MPYLEVHTEDGVNRVELTGSKVTFGRHSKNQICLNDGSVSRFHCEVELSEGGYVLRDLGSRNGTYLADQKIAEARLEPGDVFVVGATEVRFMVDDEQSRGATQTAGEAVRVSASHHARVGGSESESLEAIQIEHGDLFQADEEDADPPVMVGRSDFGSGSLAALAKVGQEVPYDDSQLALINARGSMVHAAEEKKSSTAETLKVLRVVLLACIRTGASDVHVEPKQEAGLIRLRVDGGMVEAAQVTQELTRRLMSLIKVLGDIDISKKAMVQEGHFSAQVPDRRVDYRVSFTPSMFGQKLVLRVLDPVSAPQQLRDLQLPDWMYRQIRSVARQDSGMLLACGPTGSGKTTSLYAVLRQVDARQRNVITIEDPIEYELPGATQIPVDAHQGNTFDSLLRSILRQDPDVIMVGEIRDRETATTAMQAATTGHMVLSSVHAKDTIGTIFRLLDLGVEPYLVANTINLLLAQRLARTLCPHCKTPRKPTPTESMRLGRTVEGVSQIFGPAGCQRCFGSGYVGRQAIFELFTATDEIRDVILNSPNIGTLKKAVEMTMFTPLRESGMQLVTKGLTSMEEIDRVIGSE